MISTLKKHSWFLGIYLLFVFTAIYLLITYTKTDSHLLLTTWHNTIGDFIFKYGTHLGDGVAVVAFTLLGLFWGKRHALQIGLSGLLSGGIAQFLKKVVYGPTPRPFKFFENTEVQLYHVAGVDINQVFSFPSGHATSAFCLAFSFALLAQRKRYDILFGLLGILVAYSRVYLSQHFLEDILFGSVIGMTTALAVHLTLNRYMPFQPKPA